MCKRFEKVLALHCSPALFGIKPSNLVNLSLNEFPDVLEEIEELNNIFNPKISFKVLKEYNDRILVLVYQEKKLASNLFKADNYKYLQMYDYPVIKNISSYLDFLSYKMINDYEFPHEIGVFLGYDLKDIIEYQKGNKNCILVGYWKVFYEKEKKLKIFDKYTKCKNKVFSLLEKGYSLSSII